MKVVGAKAEEGSGICAKATREPEPLQSISFVRGLRNLE